MSNINILVVGDVVGPSGRAAVKEHLWNIRKENAIDIAIVNGENSSSNNGIDPESAQELLSYGADVITTGNHIWKERKIKDYIEYSSELIRPANYPSKCPGSGYTIFKASGIRVLVVNMLGTVFMEPLSSPFETMENILSREEGNYDISVLDFHAEATSEKIALARVFDSRINVIFGTHTHVPTADLGVLPGGTGYITDVGMTGVDNSVIGVKNECIIERFTTKMPNRFEFAAGVATLRCAVFKVNSETKKCSETKFIVK